MDHRDPKPIYESPDGGKTVFMRIGNQRFQITDQDQTSRDEWIDMVLDDYRLKAEMLRETDLWRRIVDERHDDPDIAALLEQAKALYLLRKEDQ